MKKQVNDPLIVSKYPPYLVFCKQCRSRSTAREGSVWTWSTCLPFLWTHYCSVNPHCSNYRIIGATFFVCVRIFWLFMVLALIWNFWFQIWYSVHGSSVKGSFGEKVSWCCRERYTEGNKVKLVFVLAGRKGRVLSRKRALLKCESCQKVHFK